MNWEQIDNYHQRTKIPGGWLVKAFEDVVHDTHDVGMRSGWDFRIAMCFVPDPQHEWKPSEASPCPTCHDIGMIPSDEPGGDVMNTPCPTCNPWSKPGYRESGESPLPPAAG